MKNISKIATVLLIIGAGLFFYFQNKIFKSELLVVDSKEQVNDNQINQLDTNQITYKKYENENIGLSFSYPSNYPENMILENVEGLSANDDYQNLLAIVIKRSDGSYEVDGPRVYINVISQKFGKGGGVDQEGLLVKTKQALESKAVSKGETGLGKDIVNVSIKKIGKYDWVEIEEKSYYVDTYIGNTKTYIYEDNFIKYEIAFSLMKPEEENVFRKILESVNINAPTNI